MRHEYTGYGKTMMRPTKMEKKPETLLEIREMARSASSIPVGQRVKAMRRESEEMRRDRMLAKEAREKTRIYKNKIMVL